MAPTMTTTMTSYKPLIDTELKQFIAGGGIHNCPFALVNPASVNLEIGNSAKIEQPITNADGVIIGSSMQNLDLREFNKKKPYMLAPGEFILTDVKQVLNLPADCEAQVILRSSAARAGFDHALAGYVDPAYKGRLTLEFVNCRRYQNLGIYPGQQLVQLRIYRLSEPPERGYDLTGRYYMATEVEANKDLTIGGN